MRGSYRKEGNHFPLIQQYLCYYLAVRNSDHPFDLVDLHKSVSPEDLRQYIEANIKSPDLSYLQLEFLFAEMIRRLKLGKDYAGHTWPEDENSNLHKTKIFTHIFSNLLADWQNIPALASAKSRLKLTTEQAIKRLSALILLHLLKEKKIVGLTLSEQEIVSHIFRENNLFIRGIPVQISALEVVEGTIRTAYQFEYADLRSVDFSNTYFGNSWINSQYYFNRYIWNHFENSDLSYSNFENALFCCYSITSFNGASLFKSKLIDMSHIVDSHVGRFDQVSFLGTDLRDAEMEETNFYPSVQFGLNEVTKKKTTINVSTYEKYLSAFSPEKFDIREDSFTISSLVNISL